MVIVKHFRVKMRLASFCSVNLIKYTMPRDFHSKLPLVPTSCVE